MAEDLSGDLPGKERLPNDPRVYVREFVHERTEAAKSKPIGTIRDAVIGDFCAQNNIDPLTARGLSHLVKRFDRVKKPEDAEQLLLFALWVRDRVPGDFYGRNAMTYLANQDTPLQNVLENMAANYLYWTHIFGQKTFETSHDTVSPREGIWKSWLPLEGYYLSLKGGSGSGTFSMDIAIGHDNKYEEHKDMPQPLHDTGGEIGGVGFDLEISGEKEKIFRIIRTGSGQKSQKDPEKQVKQKEIRKTFLDKYKTSPQRLLLFLALEIAYTLKFDKAKALSTEGAMRLSLLAQAKSPLDYSASMTGAGFEDRGGNWLEMNNLQEDYYDILAGAGYEEALQPHEVRGFGMVIEAFNKLGHMDAGELTLKLAHEEPEELQKAWDAYARLRTQERERQSRTDLAGNQKE